MKLSIASFVAVCVTAFALCACGDSGTGDYAPAPGQVPAAPAQGAQPQDLGSALPGQPVQPGDNPPADVTPPEGAPVDAPADVAQGPTAPIMLPQRNAAPAAAATSSPNCSMQRVPGSYISIAASGRVTGATFTAATGSAAWQRLRYVAANGSTKAKPKSPAPASGQRAYVYSGTYTIKRSGAIDTVGCVTLTSAPGAANLAAQPRFAKPAHGTVTASGAITKLTVTRLSASGGSGTLLLSNGLSGTIKLTSRQRVP